MIKVAETARDEVNKLMKLDGFNPSKDFIRVGVKSGGCSGFCLLYTSPSPRD